MNPILLSVMIIIFLGLAYLIYYFFKQQKYYRLPLSIPVEISIFLLASYPFSTKFRWMEWFRLCYPRNFLVFICLCFSINYWCC